MVAGPRKASRKNSSKTADSNSPEATEPSSESLELSFEGTIHRLAEIVEELESGELPLEESLRLFEEGVTLARRSHHILQNAEQRVEQLLSVDEDGEPIVKQLQPEDDA